MLARLSMYNLSNRIPFSDQISPVECYQLQIIATLYALLFFPALIINGLVILAFYFSKDVRTTLQWLIITHCALNIFATLTELPVLIITDSLCRWPFGESMCQASGFNVYFIGCSSIYIMVAISMERYYSVQNKIFTSKQIVIVIVLCILLGIFWAALPLFGWSYYSQEKSLTSCCVEWLDRSFTVVSYNVTIFIFIFFIPVGIIAQTQISIYLNLKNRRNRSTTEKRKSQERYLIFSMSLYVGIFMIAWTPYAVVSFISAFVSDTYISALGSTIPAIFAKSSILWSSLFYLCTDKKIKFTLKFRVLKVKHKPANIEEVTFRRSDQRDSVEL